jgi:uncharacterized protein YprB with RNaseH-like and TPR domain
MTETCISLRQRLEQMDAVARPRRTAGPDGPAFELRRAVRSVREIFGRDLPRDGDDGALFLDTETTGLAGGTGTTPFLVGLAYLDGGQVVIEQYFLRRLSGEPAMLEALRDRLAEADTLVTFNGRRFDWPILEARFILSRMRVPVPAEHLDLISAARRLWHRPLGTHRLSVVERHALGIERGDDVESAEIPGIYLRYLHDDDMSLLEPVFSHNHHDVCCLIHLRRLVRRWIEEGEDPPSPVDWEGLGVLRMRAADDAGAEGALRRALSAEDDPAVRWRIAQRLARLLRRGGRWDDLLTLWEREIGGRGAWRVRALVEAAKVCQRRLSRPEQAEVLLSEALQILEWLCLLDSSPAGLVREGVSGRPGASAADPFYREVPGSLDAPAADLLRQEVLGRLARLQARRPARPGTAPALPL